ncbi:glutaredoxin family protein [Tsukamurella sp. 8F]|uniref:glutaredoxin family protein n=1 Tax=unclassified Tsukamurella TaxID=2633480 RepID=UPI0023B96153|nr:MULTISPECIES: glutaredoxin family protein [unclassified Tsukamurella]MDF0531715.1 glutaredoxin family protein [Tsukamurella sp. 8J]MDF0588961.1 glutaredoxin family protein [Tsukamurella sp. 8F]
MESEATDGPVVTLLTRDGCAMCVRARAELEHLCVELGAVLEVVDVDVAEDRELRAEYGDTLPVVLLQGAEHSYGEVDGARLRADVARLRVG